MKPFVLMIVAYFPIACGFAQSINESISLSLQYIENPSGVFMPLIGSNVSIDGSGKSIYFISYDSTDEHSYYYSSSYIKENHWSVPKRLDYLLEKDKDGNTFCSTVPLFISYDSDNIYYTRSYGVAIERKPDIWIYQQDSKEFKKVANSINTQSGETSPSISPDGKKLFFIRTMFHKHGGGIYMSNKKNDTEWENPIRLPDYINNSYIGESRICADGRTLLFSAERREGKGFRDIYITKLDEKEVWSQPENLDFVNSLAVEYSPSMTLAGDKLYFNRQEKGQSYVYMAKMPLKYRYKKFIIQDSLIVDNITNEVIALDMVNFMPKSSKISLEGEQLIGLIMNLLNENQPLKLTISAHTDDIGDEKYNLKLSQQRAEAVLNYLIAKGIARTRLTAKGYGESKPKVPNTTEQNRAMNRRVEFVVK